MKKCASGAKKEVVNRANDAPLLPERMKIRAFETLQRWSCFTENCKEVTGNAPHDLYDDRNIDRGRVRSDIPNTYSSHIFFGDTPLHGHPDGATMAVIMLAYMLSMYQNTKANIAISLAHSPFRGEPLAGSREFTVQDGPTCAP